MPTLNPSAAATTVATARALIGLGVWIAPFRSSQLFGLDVRAETSAPLWLRLGGTRDVVLATLPHVGDEDGRRRGLRTGQVCDGFDLLAVYLGWRAGRLSARSATVFAAASAACLGLGSLALADPGTQAQQLPQGSGTG